MSEDELDDVEHRLAELESRINAAGDACHDRTAIRLSREGRRIARQEHRLIPYLSFSFHLINRAADAQVMKEGCDVAVEMIALLEDEDRARLFQADLPLDEYEYSRWWHTGFAYKTLANLTGHSQGYNSEGMHQCIADGMAVCRRVGNMRDTLLFREFAVEVYRAADDLDMALHFARGSLQMETPDDSNRKVASADDIASLLELQGNLAAAVEMVQRGWQYCEEFHNPYQAKLNFLPLAREIASLAGRSDVLDQLPRLLCAEEPTDLPEDQIVRIPTEDECPSFKFLRDESLAVELACRGDFDQAIQLLQPWDRKLAQQHCMTRWFSTRCRIIAAYRLSGRMDRARALVGPLEEAARKANDWLTLHQLERLLDESIPATPVPMVGEPDCGPFARSQTTVARETHTASETPAPAEISAGSGGQSSDAMMKVFTESPLWPAINSLHEDLQKCDGTSDSLDSFCNKLVLLSADQIDRPADAELLIKLGRIAVTPTMAIRIFEWSEEILAKFSTHPDVLSIVGTLGVILIERAEDELKGRLTVSRIEQLFRQSLDLDPGSSKNYGRAGLFYLGQVNFGEAERCLSRSFRLDRTESLIALSLAQVYSSTERPRDALAVLDMALREGCNDSQVAWQASLQAIGLEQYEAALTYLDQVCKLAPERPWTNHYRAFALLELQRPQEALDALAREADLNKDTDYHIQVQRASALAQLNRVDEFRQQLVAALSIPLSTVTVFSQGGLHRILQRLWESSTLLPVDDPLSVRLQDHLVSTGLAADSFFDSLRRSARPSITAGAETTESRESGPLTIKFFRIQVRQPLDERWRQSVSCLAGEEDWTSYTIMWGVLAVDEDDARRRVLQWQHRCFPIPAEIVEVETGEEIYQDLPGIVWQGQREGQSPA